MFKKLCAVAIFLTINTLSSASNPSEQNDYKRKYLKSSFQNGVHKVIINYQKQKFTKTVHTFEQGLLEYCTLRQKQTEMDQEYIAHLEQDNDELEKSLDTDTKTIKQLKETNRQKDITIHDLLARVYPVQSIKEESPIPPTSCTF